MDKKIEKKIDPELEVVSEETPVEPEARELAEQSAEGRESKFTFPGF